MATIYPKHVLDFAKKVLSEQKASKPNKLITIEEIEKIRHINELVVIRDKISEDKRKLVLKLSKEFKPHIKSFMKDQLLSEINEHTKVFDFLENKISNRCVETNSMVKSYHETLVLKELIVEKLLKLNIKFDLSFYKLDRNRGILSSIYLFDPNIRISCHKSLETHQKHGKYKNIIINKSMTVDEVIETIKFYRATYG